MRRRVFRSLASLLTFDRSESYEFDETERLPRLPNFPRPECLGLFLRRFGDRVCERERFVEMVETESTEEDTERECL